MERACAEGLSFAADYMRDDRKRHALNRLTRRVFGFDFEDWYAKGYFRGGYAPFTFFEGDEAIANVSVNVMEFTVLGAQSKFAQIGTVMTAPEHRGRGLGRALMKKAIAAAGNWAEDTYLFAAKTATGFYEKLGFQPGEQTRCMLDPCRPEPGGDFAPLDARNGRARAAYLSTVERMRPNSALALHNFGLVAFWTASLENIWHSPSLDAYAWMELRGDTLLLHGIASRHDVSALDVIKRAPLPFTAARLGFTPTEGERAAFRQVPEHDPDCVLYHNASALNVMRDERLIFPEWSHA